MYWEGGGEGLGRKMATSGANGPGSATASASNPRKFSEKIALQKQRQAEETAAFEEVMMDIGSTRLQAQKLRLAYTRSSHYGGSLPNVNQIGCGLAEFQSPLHSPLDSSRSTRHHGLVERVQRDPRRMVSPLRRYPRHISFTEGLGSRGQWDGVPRELRVGRDSQCCPVPSCGSAPLPGLPGK